MKKISALLLFLAFTLFLVSCVEVDPLDEVESIELFGWEASEFYEASATPLDLTDASVRVTFANETSTDISLDDADLLISGTGELDKDAKELDLSDPGTYYLKFAYGGITVTVNYSVVEYLVTPSDNMKTVVEAAPAGTTIYISAGNHYVSETIDVIDKSVVGPLYDNAYVTAIGANSTLFDVAATLSNTSSIKNLDLQISSNPTEYSGMINIPKSGTYKGTVIIENNSMRGLWPGSILFFNLEAAGVTIQNGQEPEVEIYIWNNEIFNLRTGVSAHVNGTTAFELVGNNIYHTKGGLLFRDTTLEFQMNTAVIENNTWTSQYPELYLSHNEWDIVYFNSVDRRASAEQLIDASEKNNGAYVLNRLPSGPVGVLEGSIHNRSHAFVVNPEDLDDFKLHINEAAYATSQTTNEYDDTDYVNGSLNSSSTWYLDYGSGDKGDRGGNRDFYWKPAESIETAYEAIVYGGKIMVWDSSIHEFVEHTVDWDAWSTITIPPKHYTP